MTTVTLEDLQEIHNEAWGVADEAVKSLPPLLRDDDLTPARLYARHKDVLTGENEAAALLERMWKEGVLIKVECRTGRAGGHVYAYRLPEK